MSDIPKITHLQKAEIYRFVDEVSNLDLLLKPEIRNNNEVFKFITMLLNNIEALKDINGEQGKWIYLPNEFFKNQSISNKALILRNILPVQSFAIFSLQRITNKYEELMEAVKEHKKLYAEYVEIAAKGGHISQNREFIGAWIDAISSFWFNVAHFVYDIQIELEVKKSPTITKPKNILEEVMSQNMDVLYHKILYDLKVFRNGFFESNKNNFMAYNIQHFLEFEIFSMSFFLYYLQNKNSQFHIAFEKKCFEQILLAAENVEQMVSENKNILYDTSCARDSDYLRKKIASYQADIINHSKDSLLYFPKFSQFSLLRYALYSTENIDFKMMANPMTGDRSFESSFAAMVGVLFLRADNIEKFEIAKQGYINKRGDK